MGATQSTNAKAQPVKPRVPSPRFALVSDLDHTMVDHSAPNHESLLEFNKTWGSRFHHDSLLIFSTGRSPTLYWELQADTPLLTPDILVCSVGTEIMHRTDDGFKPDSEWEAHLDKGWNHSAALELGNEFEALTLQKSSEIRPHKVSFHLSATGTEAEEVISGLRQRLSKQGLKAKVIYSGGLDVDILPEGAGKGKALEYLLDKLRATDRFPPGGVQVNGDSGNDAELFVVPGVKGCMVANAHPELVEWVSKNKTDAIFEATKNCAGGILEALNHFESIPTPTPLSNLAEFVVNSCTRPTSALKDSISSNFFCVGMDGKKRSGPSGLSKLMSVEKVLTWVDDLVVSSQGDLSFASFQRWQGFGPAREGIHISGVVERKGEKFWWTSMQLTLIEDSA